MDVQFITQNPATEAYQRGQQAAQQQLQVQMQQDQQQRNNTIQTAELPSRLRQMTAGADLAQTNAHVAQATAPAQISQANSNASLAGTNATVAGATAMPLAQAGVTSAQAGARTATSNANVTQATEADRIAGSGVGLRTAQAGAQTAESNAAVTQATQGDRIQSSGIGLRQQDANLQNTKMQNFYKSIELMNAGHVEEAKAVAAQSGEQIPDALFQDADMRAAITAAAKQAQIAYPGRPADQQAYIHGFIEDTVKRKAQGQPANAPQAPYEVPGAPQPQETSLRAGQGRASVYAQKLQVGEALYGKGSKAAADYAGGLRQMSPQEAAKAAYAAARGVLVGMGKAFTEQDVTAMAQRIEAQIRTDFGQVGQSTAGAPPGPAQPGAPAGPAVAPVAPAQNDPFGIR